MGAGDVETQQGAVSVLKLLEILDANCRAAAFAAAVSSLNAPAVPITSSAQDPSIPIVSGSFRKETLLRLANRARDLCSIVVSGIATTPRSEK